jgi:hypothetical protein
MKKVFLMRSLTHDHIEYTPGLHSVGNDLAESWLKTLPKDLVREVRPEEVKDYLRGRKIDRHAITKGTNCHLGGVDIE